MVSDFSLKNGECGTSSSGRAIEVPTRAAPREHSRRIALDPGKIVDIAFTMGNAIHELSERLSAEGTRTALAHGFSSEIRENCDNLAEAANIIGDDRNSSSAITCPKRTQAFSLQANSSSQCLTRKPSGKDSSR
jgi:hypothetical protein